MAQGCLAAAFVRVATLRCRCAAALEAPASRLDVAKRAAATRSSRVRGTAVPTHVQAPPSHEGHRCRRCSDFACSSWCKTRFGSMGVRLRHRSVDPSACLRHRLQSWSAAQPKSTLRRESVRYAVRIGRQSTERERERESGMGDDTNAAVVACSSAASRRSNNRRNRTLRISSRVSSSPKIREWQAMAFCST